MQDYYKYAPKPKTTTATKLPTYKPAKPQLTEDQALYKNLETQYKNLGQRLEAVGAPEIADNRSFLEKMFNLPDDQGTLMDIIEVIERPMRGIQAGIVSATRGENIGAGFWDAFTGKNKFTGVEFAEQMGWLRPDEMTGFETFVANVAIDILMDPFTYIAPTKMIKWAFGKTTKTVGQAGYSIAGEAFEAVSENFAKRGLDMMTSSADEVITVAKDLGYDFLKFSEADLIANGIKHSDTSSRVFYKGVAEQGAGAAMEHKVAHTFANYLDMFKGGEFGDLKFLVEKAGNNFDDIKVLREMTLGNGDKISMVVDTLEVKDLIKGAAGQTVSLDLVDGVLTAKKVNQKTGVITTFGQMDEGFQEVFLEAIGKLQAMSGDTARPIADLVGEAMNIAKSQDQVVQDIITAGKEADGFLGFINNITQTAKSGALSVANFTKNLKGKEIKKAFRELAPEVKEQIVKAFQDYGSKVIDINQLDEVLKAAGGLPLSTYQDVLFEQYKTVGKKLLAAGDTSVMLDATALLSKLGLSNNQFGTTFNEILQSYFVKNADDYITFVDDAGNLQMLKSSNVFDFIDIKTGRIQFAGSSMKASEAAAKGITKPRQLRLVPTLGLKDDAVLQSKDVIEEFLSQFYVKGTEVTTTTQGAVVRLLGKLGQDGVPALIRKPAQILELSIQKLQYAFDATAGWSKKLVSEIRGIGGKSGLILQRRSEELASLAGKLQADNPKALQFARELIEAGARIDDTGQVIVTEFTPRIVDILDNIRVHTTSGNPALMNTWGKTGADLDLLARNLEDTLNNAYFRTTGTDGAFKIKIKDGALGLELNNIDSKTLNQIDFSKLGDEMFTGGGSYKISDEAKEFFLRNADDIDQFKKMEFEVLDSLKKEIGYDSFNEALKYSPGYIRHTFSREAKDFLAKQKPAVRSKYMQEGIDMLRNRAYMGTVDDVNKGMRAFYGLEFDLFDTSIQAAYEDLFRIAATKTEQGQLLKLMLKNSDEAGQSLMQVIPNRADALEDLGYGFVAVKDFKEEFGSIWKNLSPDAQKELTEHFAALGYDVNTSALAIHRSAKNMLDQFNRSFKEIPEYIRGYDKFMNTWKSITLVTPGFHMRNFFGNMTNSYLVGMNTVQQARYAGKAMGEFGTYNRLTKQLANFSGTYDDFLQTLSKGDRTSFELVTEFFESGISQRYSGVRDLGQIGKNLAEGGRGSASKQLVGANFDIAEHMDDFQRYMLYRWASDGAAKKFAGDTGLEAWQISAKIREEAGHKVSEALFDYKHYTSFEKEAMKRVFPFYTFFKNNLVFQAKTLFSNPGAVGRVGRAYKYYTEDIGGIDIEEMPDYMLDNMWLPIPATINRNDGESIAFLKANLPLSDFTEIVDNPFKRGVGSISAPVKLILELGAGTDFFTGSPLQKFPGEKDRMDPGSGVLSQIRNQDGDLALSANPIIQKIANDLGLRVPREYASVLFDVADTVTGSQPTGEGITDILARFGLTTTRNLSEMQITQLYQDLERLRNMKSRYEQGTGGKLPTKDELGLP